MVLAQSPFLPCSLLLIAHYWKLYEMEVGGDTCKAKRNGKMLNKLLLMVRFSSLSPQHYLSSLLTFQTRGRLCIIVSVVSFTLQGFQWQRLLVGETRCSCYRLGHTVLTEIAVNILGWFACVKLACFLSINSGEILLLPRVLDIVSQDVFSNCQSPYLPQLLTNFISTKKQSAACFVSVPTDSCWVLWAIFT